VWLKAPPLGALGGLLFTLAVWGRNGGHSVLQTCCPAGAGEWRAQRSTNMLPRWGRGMVGTAFYKHAAPLGQGTME